MHKPSITLTRDNTLTLPGAPCVATIGNFDGLHRGHQYVIEKVVATARAQGLPSCVITFEPAPQRIIKPQQPYQRLMRFSHKLAYLESLGVSEVLCLRFPPAFSHISAEAFVHYLTEVRNVAHLVVCKDFRFGHGQQGSIATFAQAAQGCTVETVDMLYDDTQKISSTGVRQALQSGSMAQVQDWLGRPYSLMGRVARGNQKGRLLGFPTANIPLKAHEQSLHGIYITHVTIDGKTYPSVTNVGTRPTLDGTQRISETHIFDFSQDIYSKRIVVHFIKKIRDEMRFTSKEALCEQIAHDITTAKQFFRGALWTQ